jgi:lipopolysaccharide biosynthesis glycosyltransferase
MTNIRKKGNIPVLFSADDNVAPYLATVIASVCFNTKSKLDFYVLDSGISIFHKKQITKMVEDFKNFTIEFIEIDLQKEVGMFTEDKYLTLNTYSRFLIAKKKPNIDKIIYLDADIIVLEDIKKLWEIDLEDNIIGAYGLKCYEDFAKRMEVSMEHRYFNSGVLLIDCKKWRENKKNLFLEFKKINDKYGERTLPGADESILNKYFSVNKYKNFGSNCFNFSEYNCMQIAKGDKNAIRDKNHLFIRHFQMAKPWKVSVPWGANFEDFWYFAKMTPFYEGMLAKLMTDHFAEVKRKLAK